MNQILGVVEEVFMPDEYRNDIKLDKINNNVIGFRVSTFQGERIIIEEINEFNIEIMKGDNVLITSQIIDGHYFIDIELIEDKYEI